MERSHSRILGTLLLLAVGCAEGESDGRRALTERLRLHGFKDPVALERILGVLRGAAHVRDLSILAAAIHYPFVRYEKGEVVKVYGSMSEVVQDRELLFTERVLTALREVRYDALFVRDQGAAIGRGEVWLCPYEEGLRIKAINP